MTETSKCPNCGGLWDEIFCGHCDYQTSEVEADLRRQLAKANAIIDPLNRLREDEGNSVTILCSNLNFHGSDQAIEVYTQWERGKWYSRRFEGDTLADCLAAAQQAKAEQGAGT